MMIKAVVDWAGPIFRDRVQDILDTASGKIWEKMERGARDRAGSLTERVRYVMYGHQMITAGYMLEAGM